MKVSTFLGHLNHKSINSYYIVDSINGDGWICTALHQLWGKIPKWSEGLPIPGLLLLQRLYSRLVVPDGGHLGPEHDGGEEGKQQALHNHIHHNCCYAQGSLQCPAVRSDILHLIRIQTIGNSILRLYKWCKGSQQRNWSSVQKPRKPGKNMGHLGIHPNRFSRITVALMHWSSSAIFILSAILYFLISSFYFPQSHFFSSLYQIHFVLSVCTLYSLCQTLYQMQHVLSLSPLSVPLSDAACIIFIPSVSPFIRCNLFYLYPLCQSVDQMQPVLSS